MNMPKKFNYVLDQEEQETLDALEKALEEGTLKSVPNVKREMRRIQKIATANINRMKSVRLKLSLKDINRAQEKALQEGLEWENFLSSVVHKYLAGNLRV